MAEASSAARALSFPAAEDSPAACAHCALPLAGRQVRGEIDGRRLAFCCLGCWIAMGVTRARGEAGGAAALLVRLGLGVFFAMNVMMLSAPSYVPHVYGDDFGALDGPLFLWLRWLAAAFSIPVLLLLGGPVVAIAVAGLRARRIGSEVLIALGVAAAYALSFANLVRGLPAVYFDTGAMLLVFVTLGRYLEARARADATAAVRANLSPSGAPARLVRDGVELAVAPAALVPGDRVEIGVGGAIPTDGVVERGTAGVDESMLTGESRLIVKQPGDAVAGGTCSVDGRLLVRVTARAADSAAARIEALLSAASRERSRIERLADTAAGWLIPLLLAVAIAGGAYWGARAGEDRGVLVAVAVLVVACPCGLGIATPLAVWMALQAAARRGVIVRSAPALERLAEVRRVVFDKTGTLTDGVPHVAAVEVTPSFPGDADDLLARCAALEAGMPHPLARAIAAAAAERPTSGGADLAADQVRLTPGRGLAGIVDGRRLTLGSARFALSHLAGHSAADERTDAQAIERWRQRSTAPGSRAFAVVDGRLAGVLWFAETIRPQAHAAVAALRAAHLDVRLLSGDERADSVVPALFHEGEVEAGLSPADKVARLRSLRLTPAGEARRRGGAIAMVGDGINDAPALAAADVGIAVAESTDLARLTADVAVLSGDLRAVPWLVAHARRARAIARQNLAWAFGYNAIAVALAAAGRLSPLIASAAMLASSLAVVLNACRLAGERAPRKPSDRRAADQRA